MYQLNFSNVSKNTKEFFLMEAECHDWVFYSKSLKKWVFDEEDLKSINEWILVVNAPIFYTKVKFSRVK